MCLSPHEMSTARIEERLGQMRRVFAKGLSTPEIEAVYKWRIEEFEKILKERAEAGTY